MKRILLILFSVLAPGAVQMCEGRFLRGGAFALAAFAWTSAGSVLLIVKIMPWVAEISPFLVMPGSLLLPGVFILLGVAAFLDAEGLPEAAEELSFIPGFVLLTVFWCSFVFIGLPANRLLLDAVRGPGTSAMLAEARRGQAVADRVAKAIEEMPPVVAEKKNYIYHSQSQDSFELPAGYLTGEWPYKNAPDGQEIMLYPASLAKSITEGHITPGQLMAAGLIYFTTYPIEAARRGPDFAPAYEAMMRRQSKENTQWEAEVTHKDGLPLPAALFSMNSPKQIKLFMFGKERYFSFRTYAWTPALDGISKSFKEAPPGVGGAAAGKTAFGIKWVTIHGGEFTMGSASRELGFETARPLRQVAVKTFEMSKSDVTVKQYAGCVNAGKCTEPKSAGNFCNWKKPDRELHPVNCVTWDQAKQFARFAGARLPSEAEWEYAAKSAGNAQIYPWGNEEPDDDKAIMGLSGIPRHEHLTMPVCSKPSGNTAQGLCDMAGNVRQWIQDKYQDSYNGAPTDGSALEDGGTQRVMRGGSFYYGAFMALRTDSRSAANPGSSGSDFGFRLAR